MSPQEGMDSNEEIEAATGHDGRLPPVSAALSLHGIVKPSPRWTAFDSSHELAISYVHRQGMLPAILARAWLALVTSRYQLLEKQLTLAEHRLSDLPIGHIHKYRVQIDTLRACQLIATDESLTALSVASRVYRSATNVTIPAAAITIYRLGYWRLGDTERFYAIERASLPACPTRSQVRQHVYDLSLEAAVELERLRFPMAKRLAQVALDAALNTSTANQCGALLPASILAEIYYEEGDIARAEDLLRNQFCEIRKSDLIDCAILTYATAGRIAALRGELRYMSLLLHDAEMLGEERRWPRLVAAAIAERLKLVTQLGCIAEAQDCLLRLRRVSLHCHMADGYARGEIIRLTLLSEGRFALAKGQWHDAIRYLTNLEGSRDFRDYTRSSFQTRLALVSALFGAGREEAAMNILLKLLKIGAAAGLYQSFVDAGPVVSEALVRILAEATRIDGALFSGVRPFVTSIIEAAHSTMNNTTRADLDVTFPKTMTPKEIDVMTHMGAGLTNKRIAQALSISPETVKSHIKNIFRKLSVATRQEAVTRARALGMIS
jgi:ATP/maltotriose-dependent transcriptional regulator MalT